MPSISVASIALLLADAKQSVLPFFHQLLRFGEDFGEDVHWRTSRAGGDASRCPARASKVRARRRRSPWKSGCVLPLSLLLHQQQCGEMLHLGGNEDQHKDGSHAADDNTHQVSKCIVTCAVEVSRDSWDET